MAAEYSSQLRMHPATLLPNVTRIGCDCLCLHSCVTSPPVAVLHLNILVVTTSTSQRSVHLHGFSPPQTAHARCARLYKTLKLSGTLLKGRGPTFLGYIGVSLGYVWGEPIEVSQQEPGTVDDAYLQEVHNKVTLTDGVNPGLTCK